MTAEKVYFKLTDKESTIFKQALEFIRSEDQEIQLLGLNMIKSTKFWKDVKSKSLWYNPGMFIQRLPKKYCYNVSYCFSKPGLSTYYYEVILIIQRFLTNNYFIRYTK